MPQCLFSLADERTEAKILSVPPQELNESWERERDEMKHLQNIKAEMDRVNLEIQNAERDYDLNHAAELKYGTLMQLQKQLSEAETALEAQVCVDRDSIVANGSMQMWRRRAAAWLT